MKNEIRIVKNTNPKKLKKGILQLYILALIPLIFVIIFNYLQWEGC